MLHDRILVLVEYVSSVIVGSLPVRTALKTKSNLCTPGNAKPDHAVLRSLSALVASLPASENLQFREEFETVNLYLPTSAVSLTSLP